MAKICEICGQRPARYVCKECGSSVCEQCFIPERWLCINCYRNLPREIVTFPKETTFSLPFKLFLTGFILVFIGTLILMLASLFGASPQGGGFIWIFPLPPIAFGTAQDKTFLIPLLMTTLLVLTFLLLFFLFTRRIERRAS